MRGKQGQPSFVCVPGLLVAALLWCPVAGMAGDALAATNLPVMRPVAQARPRSAAPQSELYFGSRIESVTTTVAPQNPYESNYASVRRAYHKAIIGFRLALTSRAYLFVGVGMAVPDDLLEQGQGQSVSITAAQIQNALVMQTEYGLGWDF